MNEASRADSARTDKLIGEVLANRYQIEMRLGEGAMGAVYRARHVKVGRPFAVKVLHPRLLEDDKVLQRFEREAELAGRLHHPNVIGVVDVGETSDGLRYMVMDFAEGPDLSALLSEAPMPPARIVSLTRQMLEGLYHAHEAGLIHRDFKPENVIIERDTHGDEVPRIVDFGIAILREGGDSTTGPGRLTTNGLVLGTPHYMAPEQAVNDPIDHRIDLFALGIMVYEMLCGKLPFDGSGAEVARANLLLEPPLISDRVPYLEVDPLLEAFARRMMAKKRDMRPATAKVARDLLELIVKDREAAAAALGVPLAARVPRTTQPVTPRHQGDYPGTFPPPIMALDVSGLDPRDVVTTPPEPVRLLHAQQGGKAMARPPAHVIDTPPPAPPHVHETPPQAPPLVYSLAVEAQAQRGIRTLPLEPVPFEADDVVHRRPRPMALIAAAGAVFVVLVIVIAMAMRHGASDDKSTAGSDQLVATEQHEVKHTEPIEPPAVVDTGSAIEVEQPEVKQPEIKQPEIKQATKQPVIKQPVKRPIKQPEIEQPIKQPVIKQPEIRQPEKQPVQQPTKAAELDDVKLFSSQFAAIGAELKTAAAANPNGFDDLQSKYHRITFGDAVSTQAKRDAARALFAEIHSELATRKK